MNSRPWLAVAVYARAPAAEAPIATDIATNSDSTLMYSQGVSLPECTIRPSASTMCVCGEIGYAQITSGRHKPTASATAAEPSVCLSMDGLLLLAHDEVECRGGCSDVRLGDFRGELLADCRVDGLQRHPPGQGSKAAEQRRVRQRAPDVLHRDLRGGHGAQVIRAEPRREL